MDVSVDLTICPVCGKAVPLDGVRYEDDDQVTQCPEGHDVMRSWNGPERADGGYARSVPYGWSAWRVAP